jgi:hypothetical protein
LLSSLDLSMVVDSMYLQREGESLVERDYRCLLRHRMWIFLHSYISLEVSSSLAFRAPSLLL